ncbi:MAG TPA: ImmA/IrrE family metallo-endopeptidase [Povalibacter sp.]|uniref:ImmA/IrrE family metallo-endopeptidase n=1 Tax=Povalibacter sp. TaxID=1962978 RepID=UPI002B777FCA|nr:ImmA/IrrE family metallo-endopeptidase [Povalibacter sp.]HMN45885.1 ImmA/IrrE family metallo-endopeptidase [Povalibacter sp.]
MLSMTGETDNARAEGRSSLEVRIIKSEAQYREYLDAIEKLAASDPDANSSEASRLELLAKLVEDYERVRFEIGTPDPIDAIMFRMEEMGLRQKDIADILGGKNRASEVLARKRPLTLPMIRALHEKLGIPAALLIREKPEQVLDSSEYSDDEVPLDLVKSRGWIEAGASASDLIKRFLAPAGSPVLLKHTVVFGANARTNRTRVQLWIARVREIADARSYLLGRFDRTCLNEYTLAYIAKLSWMDRGPRLAMDFLAERGIALVVEPHLPPTRLDGAAMLGKNGAPVIGLTLREDRLDNFWFTLMHELVHAWKHLDPNSNRAIADENIEKGEARNDPMEKEANEVAAEILIPRAEWRRSRAHLSPSQKNIESVAAQNQIHPAIVAGRIRFERRNYKLFSKMVGYGQVRSQFPEIKWS